MENTDEAEAGPAVAVMVTVDDPEGIMTEAWTEPSPLVFIAVQLVPALTEHLMFLGKPAPVTVPDVPAGPEVPLRLIAAAA